MDFACMVFVKNVVKIARKGMWFMIWNNHVIPKLRPTESFLFEVPDLKGVEPLLAMKNFLWTHTRRITEPDFIM